LFQLLELTYIDNLKIFFYRSEQIIKLLPDIQTKVKKSQIPMLEGFYDQLLSDLNPVSSIDIHLSNREREILILISQGFSNKGIAEHLFLSLDTVKSHNRHAFKKLGVKNRTQATLKAQKLDLI